ncbi:polymorphic toxin type 43 domain-containing protein [Legionella cardiaca]|uniref:Polymorphic toxin type 43 domain-containing protein n=1 Tax=Legionella cardiaca TaxID=1071983 RepID=A0ABY8AS19_9GAMM|nr:polymorphic toxin type 43 domain-containing protein [Legionella cardiaca]WED43475.1 polymorphic toxin type 43 domain-containing protein [Legionella cardiaca]
MKAKNELQDKVIAKTKWGNRYGVAAIILGEPCGYPLGVIKDRSSKAVIDLNVLFLKNGKDEGSDLGFIDFVFDHKTGFIGITFSKNFNPFGHDGIADALLSPGWTGSDPRRAAIVGGRIAFLNGMFFSTEWSGHYGDLWNESIIGQFQSTFYWTTKQPIQHIKWKDDAPAEAPAEGEIVPHQAAEKLSARLLVSCGIFAVNNRTTADGVKANTPLSQKLSETVASYLPSGGKFAANNGATAERVNADTPLGDDLSEVVVSYLPKTR